ncbi:MAG: hypothetical protein QM758_22725 [Armatimonas sp.]
MRRSRFLFLSFSLSLNALLPLVAQAQGNDPGAPEVWAITGAKIVPVGSPTIEKGTLVLRDGRIEALGADVKPPADAKVIDGNGLTLYPALIDASTKVGMPAELPTPSYTVPTVRAENEAAALFKPDAAAAKNWRAAGFGVALTLPQAGLFGGTGALVSLADGDTPSLLLRQNVGMRLDLFSFDNAGSTTPAHSWAALPPHGRRSRMHVTLGHSSALTTRIRSARAAPWCIERSRRFSL